MTIREVKSNYKGLFRTAFFHAEEFKCQIIPDLPHIMTVSPKT